MERLQWFFFNGFRRLWLQLCNRTMTESISLGIVLADNDFILSTENRPPGLRLPIHFPDIKKASIEYLLMTRGRNNAEMTRRLSCESRTLLWSACFEGELIESLPEP